MCVFDVHIRSSQVAPLLQHHPHLQEELRGLFQQFRHQSLSLAAASRDMKTVFESPDGIRTKEVCVQTDTARGAKEEEEEEAGRPAFAKNISLVSSGGKVSWTR